jgi:polyhydroxybutyrate depolymerase
MRATALIVAVAACSGSSDGGLRQKTFGGSRPVDVLAPAKLTPGKRYPLVVVLHGLGSTGLDHADYFRARTLVDTDAALLLAPDGTLMPRSQRRFWNADPACCDLEEQHPDDVSYLAGLVEQVSKTWPVDKNAVFIIGHSNGGYMAYRMACERADLFAGIVSLAGNASSLPDSCKPSRPVSVLHLHGDEDEIVAYEGGSGFSGIGAIKSVQQWAALNKCGTTRTPTVTLDLDTLVAGAETRGETTAGCPANVAVDLWTMEASTHIPVLAPQVAKTLLDWLLAHKR